MVTDVWLRRLAMGLRRVPWSCAVLQRVMRLFQPRFSAGVVGVVPDVSGARVLLVEHVFHARYPWGLPGGWVNRGEEPAQTAAREIFEETGLRVRVVCPLLVRLGHHNRRHLDIVYLCALDGDGQAVRLSRELLSYCWTPFDELPSLVEFHAQAVAAFAAAVD